MQTDGRRFVVLCLVLAAATVGAITLLSWDTADRHIDTRTATTFKVATWNLRGGSGEQGWNKVPTPFNSDTGNCAPRPVRPPTAGRIVAVPEVNGLHHRYDRAAA